MNQDILTGGYIEVRLKNDNGAELIFNKGKIEEFGNEDLDGIKYNDAFITNISDISKKRVVEYKFKNNEKVVYDYYEDFQKIFIDCIFGSYDTFLAAERSISNAQDSNIDDIFYNNDTTNTYKLIINFYDSVNYEEVANNTISCYVFIEDFVMKDVIKNSDNLIEASFTLQKLNNWE